MKQISELIRYPEGRTLEFKRDLSSLKPILRTIVAFANTAGGMILIGRDDQGNVLGINNVFKAEERLANAIADGIYPSLFPEIEIMSIEDKALLLVRVAHWQGPFYLKSQGMPGGVYLRLGSTNRIAGPHQLEELKRTQSNISFDQLPCPSLGIKSLDMERIEKNFSHIGKKVNEFELETLGLLVRHGGNLVCSNGGIILFGINSIREQYFPNATIRCARFRGEKKVDFVDRYDIQKNLIEAMTEVSRFIQRNTRISSEISETRRKDITEYPSIPLREALANALVHADYSIRGMNPRITVFSNKLEVESPGSFPFGFTLEDFFAGVSHVRNKVIARVFREFGLMEEWGTGYRRIKEVCKQLGYETPTWSELGSSVRVTFSPHRVAQLDEDEPEPFQSSKLSLRQEKILALFEQKNTLTARELKEKLDIPISDRMLRVDLLFLKKRGLLTTTGKGPSTCWKQINNKQ